MLTQPFNGIAKDDTQKGVYWLLLRILNILKSPPAFDRLLNRLRTSAVIESGTVTTVTTVGNLNIIDGMQGRTLMMAANRQSWAANVRARIS